MQTKNLADTVSAYKHSIHPFSVLSTLEECQNPATARAGGESPPSPSPASGQPRTDNRHNQIVEALTGAVRKVGSHAA